MSIQNNTLPDNPQIQVIKSGKTGLFTNYIWKAIPLAFDESMSYYETLLGLLHYLKNVVIPTVNNNADAVSELQNLYIELKSYVDDYFTNLDVQEEINNKLDAMVEDGTLQEIIASYLNSKAIFGYDTVESMKQATNLINGSYAQTLGFYTKNDGGSAVYKIRTITNDDIIDEMTILSLYNENLVAELIIKDKIKLSQLGLNNNNATEILKKAIENFNEIIIDKDITIISTNLQLSMNNKIIKSNNKTINITYTQDNNFQLNNCNNLKFENIIFKSINHSSSLLYIFNSNNIEFNNCIIDGNGYNNGIKIENQVNNGISFNDCNNINFKNNVVKNIGYRYGIIFTSCNNIIIKNNYFNYIGGSAIELSNSNNKIIIDGNICEYCNINNLGSDFSQVTDGVIDTYGKLDDTTSSNKDINIINNIINHYGVQEIPNSGIRISGSKDVNISNNIIKNRLVNDTYGGYYIMIQNRNDNPSSNINISNNQFLCDDENCFPSTVRFQHSGVNTKFNNNIFDSIIDYNTTSKQIIHLLSNVKEMEIKNNIIGNQTHLTKGVPITINGSENINIYNNTLNTSYRGLICSGGKKINIIENQVNNGHNYAMQIIDASDNVKLLYNRISVSNGTINISVDSTNIDEIGTYKWV